MYTNACLISFCMGPSYLPEVLMRKIVVPVVKNEIGDISDRKNHRLISLATTTAKIVDHILDIIMERHLNYHDAQFGFRAGLFSDSSILSLKYTFKYYTDRKTSVYALFLRLVKSI